jgi:hypothetical protein
VDGAAGEGAAEDGGEAAAALDAALEQAVKPTKTTTLIKIKKTVIALFTICAYTPSIFSNDLKSIKSSQGV